MSDPVSNLLLQSLSAPARDSVLARGTAVPLPFEFTLYRPNEPISHVYFPTSGMASVVAPMADGVNAEEGMIGREGMVGSVQLIGPALPSTFCTMQIAGTGIRVPVAAMREIFRNSDEVRERVLQYVQVQTLSLAQVAACNRLHEAEERLARWLLMAHDRSTSDLLDLTQRQLAEMLGARRTTVTMIAGTMQRSGLIEYERGRVRITDRKRLEETACHCYEIMCGLQDQFLKAGQRG